MTVDEIAALRALVALWRDMASSGPEEGFDGGHCSGVLECAYDIEALLPPDFGDKTDRWRMLVGAAEAQRERHDDDDRLPSLPNRRLAG